MRLLPRYARLARVGGIGAWIQLLVSVVLAVIAFGVEEVRRAFR